MSVELIQGDCVEVLRTLPEASVHCCITSPPYFGLRDYGTDGQIGLEATPDLFVAKMVEVFREVRRVLRDDGTLWLNLGDSFASGMKGSGGTGKSGLRRDGRNEESRLRTADQSIGHQKFEHRKFDCGLAPKQLIGIPWRVAFALQADGWYLRSDIIWYKPNPMPESVEDRPTKAHEYLFLLSKSERYFYDADAVREEATCSARPETSRWKAEGSKRSGEMSLKTGLGVNRPELGRNLRSVWTVATRPFKHAHFATFPAKLIEPCILAGTSEAGCCKACGTPFVRLTEPTPEYAEALAMARNGHDWYQRTGDGSGNEKCIGKGSNRQGGISASYRTTGFRLTCHCNAGDAIPCTVLDPFSGAGTTGVVAVQHGRSYVGIDINAKYLEMGRRRLRKVTPYLPMFAGPIERPEPKPVAVAVEPDYPLFPEE